MNNHYNPYESDFTSGGNDSYRPDAQQAPSPEEYYSETPSAENQADNYARYGEDAFNGTVNPSEPKAEPLEDSVQENAQTTEQTSYSANQPYSRSSYEQNTTSQNQYGNNVYSNSYQQNPYASSYNSQNPYGSYSSYGDSYNARTAKKTTKKEKKPVTRSTIAAVIAVCMIASAALGVGGGLLAGKLSSANTTTSKSGALVVSKSDGESPDYHADGSALSTTEIVNKVADSVVEITTEAVKTGTFNQSYIQQGAGSGVIISTDGYIITNYHVIEGASNITVTLKNQTEYTNVEVVGVYSDGDIALLKIKPKEQLTAATFGDSSKLSVGDYSVVIGNPLGQLGGSVTDGIVSALDREVTIDDVTMNLLQTNAEISPGNSGGGLFNGNGELVGIVNAKSSESEAEGIGFAIPINDVQDVLSDLKEYGYVKGQIDLGMSLTDITSTAQLWMYGVSDTGVYVTGVNRGSNADEAGFSAGDIITKINGETVESTKDVKSIINKLKVGDTATFSVTRSGRKGTISMKLEEYKDTFSSDSKSNQESEDEFSFDPFDGFGR